MSIATGAATTLAVGASITVNFIIGAGAATVVEARLVEKSPVGVGTTATK